MNNQKLYIITRSDLPPGYQATQSTHSALNFAIEHPEIFKEWQQNSNYIAQLSIKDKKELSKLADKARYKGIKITKFYEPDLNGELTSICLEPSLESKKLCSNLPLMLKEYNNEKNLKIVV